MAFVIFCSSILSAFLGLLVYKKSINRIQKRFAFVSFVVSFWLLINVLYFIYWKYPFINLSYAVGALLVYVIFDWTALFANRKIHIYVRTGIIFAIISVMIIAMVPNLMIKSGELEKITYGYYSPKTSIYVYFSAVCTIFFLASMIFLIKSVRQSKGLERLRNLYVLYGFGIPIIIVILLDFILPFFIKTWIDSLDALASIVFVAIIGYAITKNRFLEVAIIIRKSVIQIATFIILFGIYAYVLLLVQRETSSLINLNSNTTLLFAIVLIAITIEPLRKLIYKRIDELFHSKEREREDSLKRLQIVATSNLQFQNLVEQSSKELERAFGVTAEFLLFDKTQKELAQYPLKGLIIKKESLEVMLMVREEILIFDELPYRIEAGESNLKSINDWMKKENVLVTLPIGIGEEFIGLFILKRNSEKIVFTQDMVNFMKKFKEQMYIPFASSLAYKQAVERIKV